jgi:hypothetical protein
VATSLGLECDDREILTRIAQEAHIAERLVSPLDERDARTWLSDWVVPLITGSYLTPYGYLHHLARVVDHIARSQGGVILGRGAHLILRPGRALRVRVVAPLAVRVATVAAREGLSEAAARRRVVEVERERQAFLQRCFRAPLDDASTFDLQVNTGVIGVEGAVGAVCVAATALAGLRPRTGGTASVPEAPAALDARR